MCIQSIMCLEWTARDRHIVHNGIEEVVPRQHWHEGVHELPQGQVFAIHLTCAVAEGADGAVDDCKG